MLKPVPLKAGAGKRPAVASTTEGGRGSVGGAKKGSRAGSSLAVPVELPPLQPIDGRELWLATDALHKEKAQRQYFQLERDRILSFWEILKKDLSSAKAQLREKEVIKAEEAGRHAINIEVLKQRIRHVLYEHEVHLGECKLEAERALQVKLDEFSKEEAELRREVQELVELSRVRELENRDLDARLLEEHDRAITEQQYQFEREIKEVHLKYEKTLKTLREDMEEQRKREIASIEQRKEEHVAELREMHDRSFREIKEYYNEITTNNLETIRMLKDEVYSRKRTEAHNEKAMLNVANMNRKLTEPLRKLQKQKQDLEQNLMGYTSNKATLNETKAAVKKVEQRIKTVEWEHEVLSQRYAKLVEDRDMIFAKYNDMLQSVQSKALFRRVLIDKKLSMVKNTLERREQGLHDVLVMANVDPDAIQGIEQRVRDVSTQKDRNIAELQSKIEQLSDTHDTMVLAYEQYLTDKGLTGAKRVPV